MSRKENATTQRVVSRRVAQPMQWLNPQHVEKAEEVAQKSLQLSAPIQDDGGADLSPATVANKPPSQTH